MGNQSQTETLMEKKFRFGDFGDFGDSARVEATRRQGTE